MKDDVLVEEWVITGTNKGEFNGAKPTNKTIGIHGASVLTLSPEGLFARYTSSLCHAAAAAGAPQKLMAAPRNS